MAHFRRVGTSLSFVDKFSREHRVAVVASLITVVTAAGAAAAAVEWGHEALPYLWGVVGVGLVALALVAFLPGWRQRRLMRRGGVVRIVGGYKSAGGRRIEYEDGTVEMDVPLTAAIVAVSTVNAEVTRVENPIKPTTRPRRFLGRLFQKWGPR